MFDAGFDVGLSVHQKMPQDAEDLPGESNWCKNPGESILRIARNADLKKRLVDIDSAHLGSFLHNASREGVSKSLQEFDYIRVR